MYLIAMKKFLLLAALILIVAGPVAAKETTKVERVMKKACDVKERKVTELNKKLNTLRTKLDRAVAKKADTMLVDTAKTAIADAQSAVDTQSKAACEDLRVLEASLK